MKTTKVFNKVMGLLGTLHSKAIGGIALLVSAGLMISGREAPLDPAWITVISCGVPIAYGSIRKLIKLRQIKAGLLITMAMIASIAVGELFAAGEVAFIMAIGGILEDLTVLRAKKGLESLIKLAPVTARRITGDKDETVSVESVKVGETLRILPGEAFPLDGRVIKGTTTVDQSLITGESLPVDKEPGDDVFCGTINRFGVVDISVSGSESDSSLQKMIRLVKEAEEKKAPMQSVADAWASWLVPAALAIAVITYFVTWNLIPAVTVLVVFCPCSLALATPTSIMAAIGQAAKHGVLIKSGAALEAMGKVNCIAFDKTGTLTEGRLSVCNVISLTDVPEHEIVSLAAAVETRSEHPLATAILAYHGGATENADDFSMRPGGGVSATVHGRRIVCGNVRYLQDSGINISKQADDTLATLQKQGKATLVIAVDSVCTGIIALTDTIRPGVKSMVTSLEKIGIGTVLLTGDNARAAEFIASKAGITDVKAGLLPEDKVSAVESLRKLRKTVAMVGDGVNDAPSIKAADIGLAMGSFGSDIAIDSADIALMGDDPGKITYTVRLAVETLRTIRFNITLSMTVNIIAVSCGIFGLLTPITGAIVHNIGSLLVVLNAAALYDRRIPEPDIKSEGK